MSNVAIVRLVGGTIMGSSVSGCFVSLLTILGLLFFWLVAGFSLNLVFGISLSLAYTASGVLIGLVAALLMRENYHSD